MKYVYFFSYKLLGPPLSVSHVFFFYELTNPQDRVQLNNIFEKVVKEKTYLENYSVLTEVRENFDRHEEFI